MENITASIVNVATKNIPIGCILPAYKLYLFCWLPLGVSIFGGRVGICRELGIPTPSGISTPQDTYPLDTFHSLGYLTPWKGPGT